MSEGPETNAERLAAICLLLPDDPDRALNLATVACAAAVLMAGVDDDTALHGLRAALDSMRDGGYGEERH